VGIVRTGPVNGLILQVAVLATLAATVGLDAAGAAVGLVFGVVTCAALGHGLRRSGAPALGPADLVTLARAILMGAVTALVVDSLHRPVPVGVLVGLTVVALLLDAVDGQVARRTGTASALGARFDMEADAYLILVLCVYDVRLVGGWVLAIGAMRYAFVAAGWAQPWLRGQLPPRYWRKVVAAAQGVLLTVVAADLLPRWLTLLVALSALAMLVESFGHDVLWLWHRRTSARGELTPVDVTHVPPIAERRPRVHRERHGGERAEPHLGGGQEVVAAPDHVADHRGAGGRRRVGHRRGGGRTEIRGAHGRPAAAGARHRRDQGG
jgi:phosphatidylglycerophosphate synthase